MKMKSFVLSLNRETQRPITKLYNVNTLIDTGAIIPTFSLPLHVLGRIFRLEKIADNVSIGGFGGSCYGDLCTIHDFKIGDFNFSDLDVFVPYNRITKYPFLLSATMFYGTDYDINTISGMMTVSYPDSMPLNRTFKVENLEGQLYAQIDGILLQDPIEVDGDIDFLQFEEDFGHGH